MDKNAKAYESYRAYCERLEIKPLSYEMWDSMTAIKLQVGSTVVRENVTARGDRRPR